MVENLFALMLVGVPVGIRILDTDDPSTARLVADAVRRAVEARGQDVRLLGDEHDTQAKLGVDDVVLLRVFMGVTNHQVIIEYSSAELKRTTKARVSLSSDGDGWEEALAPVIDLFFPRPIERADTGSLPPQRAEHGLQLDTFWGPAMIIAGGIVVATASILAERSAHARSKLFAGASDSPEYDSLRARWRDLAIASVALFGLGALLTGGGITLSFGW